MTTYNVDTPTARDDAIAAALETAGTVQTVAGVAPVDGDVSLDAGSINAQPADADLTAIAGLDAATAGTIGSDGAGWIKKTWSQVKTALALTKADVGLGAVDDTADTAKPVSTAQQTALDLKADATALTAETARATGIEALKADLVAGKIPVSQIPAASFDLVTHVATIADMLAIDTAGKGAFVKVADDGDGEQALFLLPAGADPTDEANWLEVNFDADGAAAAAQAAAETFASGAVAGEATIARAAESANATAIAAEATTARAAEASKAPIASPTFTGDARAVTPTTGDNDTSIATTAFVHGAVADQHAADNAAYEPIVEPVTVIAASGTAQTLGYGNTLETLTGNCTNTLPAPVVGQEVVVRAVQDGTGGRTLAWATASGSIVWDGGAAPSYLTTAGNVSQTVFTCFVAGTWDAVVSAYDLR